MTHINAYYQDVDEKKAALEVAKGELERAERALKAHPDYVEPEEEKVEEANEPSDEPKKEFPRTVVKQQRRK